MVSVAATVADANRLAVYELNLDPSFFGFPRDEQKPGVNAWSLNRIDAPRKTCIASLAVWAERLRTPLRQSGSTDDAAALPPPACRGVK